MDGLKGAPEAMDRQAFERLRLDYQSLRWEYDRVLTWLKLNGHEQAFQTWNFRLGG